MPLNRTGEKCALDGQLSGCFLLGSYIIAGKTVSLGSLLFREIFRCLPFSLGRMMRIRISLVHYLNSAPLGWAFLHGPFREQFEVIPSSPAVCADQLSRGEVAIGLIPSIEYQRIPNLHIIPEVSISSRAAVRSILLIRHKGTPQIRTVALDTSSRTSVALAKILLHANMGLHPEFVPHAPDPVAMLERCDAALLIGDAALKIRLEEYDTTDLAELWVRWQQLPFVCAFWACRDDAHLPADLSSVFQQAREWGLERRDEIASVFSKSLNLPVPFLENYLRQNIDFDLGVQHLEGLLRFYELAKQEALIPEFRPPQFLPS
jgi:chorismate dehydratase